MCGNNICEVSKSFTLTFYTNFQVFLVSPLLPAYCKCWGLSLLLIIHNDAHTLGRTHLG